MGRVTIAICPHRALNNNRGSVATYAILVLRKPYNLYRISPSMNRLNRIIGMLNLKLAEYMYVMMWTEDEGERRKGMEGVERVVKERSVWEGIRDSVRGRVKG